jgi:predicted AAA+ superfamily ATPase
LRLRPMTFFENGISSGEVSISKLFEDEVDVVGQSDLEIKDVIDQLCIGGWPVYAKLTPNDAQEAMQAYLNEIVHTDMHRVDGVKRDPTRIKKVLRSYSRHISTQADLATISKDVYANTGADNSKTVASDLAVLERLMLVEEIPAWSPHLRSRITLRKTATRHFVDPCLAAAMLSASPTKLFNDLDSFGLLFESLAVRDLRVYSQPLGAELFHYRDNKGLEIDVIISLADGRWAAIEVKLGTAWIDDAAGHLLQLVEKVDAEKIGKPTFLAVLTSTGSAYQRRDGVLVLPIGTLGP